MRIALAGVGEVGSYFAEEFSKSKHDVVVLTRKEKHLPEAPGISQRITDYSPDDLVDKIGDCDALVSTIGGANEAYVKIHDALLEACRRSEKCKRFIPSEWTINIEDFPDQPYYHNGPRISWKNKLKQQSDIKYTLVCSGWFADYIFPSNRRYLSDVGLGFPVNHDTRTFHIPGDGRQLVSLTSVRDTARAVLAILAYDGEWPQYTHIAGQTVTYLEFFDIMKQHESTWTKTPLLFSQLLDTITTTKQNESSYAQAALAMLGFMRCNEAPGDRKLVWGEGILEGIQPRNIAQLLKEADDNPDEKP
ncbi:hypothetical protein NW762_010663 [Fusarium torreyae]|uniref:NAD(P)-binding domain-containing protein n=1 Tax=Fusarium torreyae TaxID=1237075 RepID=A0A9W8RUQ7_9HYPO|nr:hypothetical protein NW762_010663 [Fusarium torreyae]